MSDGSGNAIKFTDHVCGRLLRNALHQYLQSDSQKSGWTKTDTKISKKMHTFLIYRPRCFGDVAEQYCAEEKSIPHENSSPARTAESKLYLGRLRSRKRSIRDAYDAKVFNQVIVYEFYNYLFLKRRELKKEELL